MDVSEKRRLILKGCEKWKGHWVRVYLTNGADFRVKAEELREMVEKNQLNLNLVKEVKVDDLKDRFRPMSRGELKIPKYYDSVIPKPGTTSTSSSGSGGEGSGSSSDMDKDKKSWEVLLGVLAVLVVLGFLLRR